MSLLTNQSEVNPNKAFWAPASGGGGGGGGGPNQSFSTITMSSLGGLINFTTTLTFNDLATTNGNDFVINSGIPDTAIVQGFGGAGQASVVAIRAPSSITTNGIQPAVSLNMGATDAASAVIASTNPNTGLPSTLWVIADKVRIPNDLTVSSINGAAPGGGGSVPMNLGVSTLTLNSQPTALGGTLAINANDVNLYNFAVTDSNAAAIANFSLGTIGGRNQFYTTMGQIDQLYTSSMIGSSGQISLNPAGPDSIRLGGLGAPGDITLAPAGGGVINMSATTNVPGFANISSLTVSSINGAAPGGGGNGGAIGVQSIPDTGLLPIVCDAPGGNGNPTALTTPLAISTLLGHTYTYTATASIQAGPNQTNTSAVQFQLGNNSRFYDQVRPVSTIVGPNTLVSLNWRFIGSGGGNAIYGYAWDPLSNAASTIVTLTGQSLTDYGIIL